MSGRWQGRRLGGSKCRGPQGYLVEIDIHSFAQQILVDCLCAGTQRVLVTPSLGLDTLSTCPCPETLSKLPSEPEPVSSPGERDAIAHTREYLLGGQRALRQVARCIRSPPSRLATSKGGAGCLYSYVSPPPASSPAATIPQA